MEDDDKYTRITLRIPKDIHRTLGAEADRTSKSLNAEIVARLQSSFNEAGIQFSRAASSDDSDTFFELIRTQRKTIDTQEAAILTLQSYLVDVINALPKNLQSDERVKIAAKFALQLEDGGKPAPYQVPLQIKDPGRPYEMEQDLMPEISSSKVSAPLKKRTANPQKKQ